MYYEGDWVGIVLSLVGVAVAAGVVLWIRRKKKAGDTGPPK